ncbi:unnamed protein product [Penicillium nalgiovense]|uniref:Uncharacterized protein n=1 Tax=Penicillium nalgiovense TaxID=60175 RepID=A0A9W4I5Q5_PENNA|nr:unnamed protein product [Penicillium nalgiovense]CAG8050144.1 unnamed protein product [Penicillium nalgiovense]CAG8050525.1 unnamed protein product [Penicillium nalgiovense]CAG8050869.1 unnamed protein product [Penicillium nalgiovense]CAG8052819.1 unnamed protein product [Penicillium nalgiovense]
MSSQPVNLPVDPLQDHDALRKKFEEKADSILDGLESKVRSLMTSIDFKLLTQIEYSMYKIDSARIPKHMRHHYNGFDEAFYWSSSWPLSDTELMYEKAFRIAKYIDILKHYSKKDDTSSIEKNSNWYQILAEDSFHDGPQGMLYGLPVSCRQWQEDPENPDTIRPQIIYMICTGAMAKSSELLHGEIGPIVSTIQCRLPQEEFKQTSSFPVLVISLFGPRQGRILYARFNIDGTLIVRASDIFDFEKKKNQEGFDLMRCYNCEPEDVAEFGSIAPVKKARSPTIAVGRTSQ